MNNIERVTLIVLDSAGVGELPDADKFGDVGSNTFGHIADSCGGISLPNMENLGLGNLTAIKGVPPTKKTTGCYGKALELSKGKDTTVGHWEIAGLVKDTPFPSYPNGFSKEVLDEITRRTGRECLCNLPYSGTKVLEDYGEEQEKTGKWIVYTSADPVLQIAANEEQIPLKELYEACKIALEICKEKSPVARVIARPYLKSDGKYTRTSNRHDYAVAPDGPTVLDRLKDAKKDVIGVGKINDIFTGQGITDTRGTNKSNKDGILKTIKALKEDTKGLIFTNLVDFDMLYGHRRDPEGYKKALEEFDSYLPEIYENLKDNEILIITADHGCDPTYRGSDHTREYIPILIAGKNINPGDIGVRKSFTDIASTIESLLLNRDIDGSFHKEI
ncbi:MAG: phosphopentomutase [Spirochaetaceae bacterium 4572_7]|nr:MAG: phosphopentomutase [Spirochaetaceae bacterium 4572_7]